MIRKLLLAFLVLTVFGFKGYSQKLVQSFKVTFDESLNPILSLKLQNKLGKQVSQVVYQFQFADMSGWTDTSVARSLAAMSTTTAIRTINLKPGESTSDTFRVPLPDGEYGSGKEPKIRILRVRYSDGTLDSSFSQ